MNLRAFALIATLTLVGVAGAAHGSIPPAPLASLHGRITYSTRAGDIWVMNANGTHRRRITRSGRGIDFDPDFSPDGKRIVFRTSRGHYLRDRYGIGLEGIFVVKVRTGRAREIQPRTGGLFPAWSPDGRLIAFSGLVADGRPVDTVHVMTPAGRDVVDLGPPGECSTWSPDGSQIAFCSHSGDGNWAVWTRAMRHSPALDPSSGPSY